MRRFCPPQYPPAIAPSQMNHSQSQSHKSPYGAELSPTVTICTAPSLSTNCTARTKPKLHCYRHLGLNRFSTTRLNQPSPFAPHCYQESHRRTKLKLHFVTIWGTESHCHHLNDTLVTELHCHTTWTEPSADDRQLKRYHHCCCCERQQPHSRRFIRIETTHQ